MKKLFFIFLSVFMLGAYSFSFASEGIRWYSLTEGMEKSKNEKKPSIVDFWYGVECPRCERLQKDVYSDPMITKKIMADFVPIRIDISKPLTDEEEALGNKFDYKHECLLLFLDHNGEVLSDKQGTRLCFVDSVDPEWFVSYLDMIRKSYKRK